MQVITIGKRLVPAEQIALVETFDPAGNPEFKPEREYKARVIVLNRDTVLMETAPEQFAEASGFHPACRRQRRDQSVACVPG
jgi:hypothetical protein